MRRAKREVMENKRVVGRAKLTINAEKSEVAREKANETEGRERTTRLDVRTVGNKDNSMQ